MIGSKIRAANSGIYSDLTNKNNSMYYQLEILSRTFNLEKLDEN